MAENTALSLFLDEFIKDAENLLFNASIALASRANTMALAAVNSNICKSPVRIENHVESTVPQYCDCSILHVLFTGGYSSVYTCN